jgi:glycosyltransferase involved in cell wall biosynthesis
MMMENNIRYSILTPTLNEEKYIGVLLKSLAAQTCQEFEVIIIDAHSTDKTKERVLEFKDKLNLRFIESPKKGISFQRNYAAKLAQTENLIFFDADVSPDSDFIDKIDKYLRTHPVDILTSWNIPMSDKMIDELMFWVFNQLYMEPMKRRKPVAVGTFIYAKKKAFEEVGGFSEEVVLGEDFDLARRMYEQGYKYALLKKPGIKFSVRRLNKEGRRHFIWKNLKAAVYWHTKGPIKDYNLFKHQFGEHI